MILKQVLAKALHFLQCYWISQTHMKCCNLVKAERMRKMKLSVCCYVTRKKHSGKLLFWMLSLKLQEKTLGSQSYAYAFFDMKWASFYWYCYLSETKNLFIISFFFSFLSHQKQISNIKTTEIHAARHTLDNLWTFLTTLYQQYEKIYVLAKNKTICAYVGP